MSIELKIKKLMWKLGYDISRFSPEYHRLARRKQILDSNGIDAVIDVGANTGQFGQQLRALSYRGRIYSYEPLPSAFDVLKARAERDGNWQVFNVGLGDIEERRSINISGNSYSSSLLEMLPAHVSSDPESAYIGQETIALTTLDSMFGTILTPQDQIYLKIDTQGYESKVLEGAQASLQHIRLIQIEMSLMPLYLGAPLLQEMLSLMSSMNYNLVAVEPAFTDKKSGQLLQIDGVFQRQPESCRKRQVGRSVK